MPKTNHIVILSVAILFVLLGCLCSAAGAPAVPPTPRATASAKDFTTVRLHKGDGTLSNLLKVQANMAQGAKRHPYVEFDATWCPPCLAIHDTLDEGDPLMVDAFAGTYIIQVDIDEWENDLAGAGYDVPSIPVYYELDKDGRATGRKIGGDVWGDNIPENMAPPLKNFFQAN